MKTKEERQRAKEERIRSRVDKKDEKRRLKEEKKLAVKQTEEPVKKETKVEPAKTEPKKVAPKKVETKKDEAKEVVKKNMKKNYHVSRREKDGKWQVKFAKGEKAIKLFDTQAEAIAYAKDLAERNDGTHTIHKKDGKIRKKTY